MYMQLWYMHFLQLHLEFLECQTWHQIKLCAACSYVFKLWSNYRRFLMNASNFMVKSFNKIFRRNGTPFPIIKKNWAYFVGANFVGA